MLKLKTRLGVMPSGRGRILLYFHENQIEFVEKEFIDELLKMKDCAVYYYDSSFETETDEQPDSIQMVVVLVTNALFDYSSDKLTSFLEKTQREHIPMVPLLTETVPIEKFEQVFGKVQYITWFQESDAQISYRENVSNIISRYLVTDELREKVASCFRKKLFLSYRKSDRLQAKELMKKVHSIEENIDVAIWYDEMLVAGDEYNMAILGELKNSDAFLLTVTPNVLKKADSGEENYVKRIEIPAAKDYNKEIIAVEMCPTQQNWQEVLGLEEFQCVSLENVSAVCTEKLGGSLVQNMTSEKQYLLGMAYLEGILVEKNMQLGVRLLEASANAGYQSAIREMKERHFTGNGLPCNYIQSFFWLEKLINDMTAEEQFGELEKSLQEYLEAGAIGIVYEITDRMFKMAGKSMKGNIFEKTLGTIKMARVLSYAGDAKMRDNNPQEAVYYANMSCQLLEEFFDNLNSVDMITKTMILPWEQEAIKTLWVNYDHLSDYLTRLGRVEESKMVLNRRNALYKTDIKEEFFDYVRRAQNYKNENDLTSAEACLLKALELFDKKQVDETDWKLMREKAVILYSLAEVYILHRKLTEEQRKVSSDCILQAMKIVDKILAYDPQNVDALRDKAIILEIAAHFHRHKYEIRTMVAMLGHSKKLREEIAHKFSSNLANADVEHIHKAMEFYGFYPKTFVLSKERETDAYGNRWAVLYPTNMQEGFVPNTFLNSQYLPRVPIGSILRMVRANLNEENLNVTLTNIGAEILINRDSLNPDVSLILYEIVDSKYRVHYVLLFSMEALNAKMYEAGIRDYFTLINKNDVDHITIRSMGKTMLYLIKEFFGKKKDMRDIRKYCKQYSVEHILQEILEYSPNTSSPVLNEEYYMFSMIMDYS